jgi:hypothetical protein
MWVHAIAYMHAHMPTYEGWPRRREIECAYGYILLSGEGFIKYVIFKDSKRTETGGGHL